MQNLLKTNEMYWAKIRSFNPKLSKRLVDAQSIGHFMESLYLAKCYTACYNGKSFSPFDSDDITKLLITLANTL